MDGEDYYNWLKEKKIQINHILEIISTGKNIVDEEETVLNLYKEYLYCTSEL